MNLAELKDLKAGYEKYGTMILHAEAVNFLFDVAIAAQTIGVVTLDGKQYPPVAEEAPKPARRKKAD